MGILPEKKLPQPVRIEDTVEITYADYVFDDSDEEEEVVIVTYDETSEDDLPTLRQQLGQQREITRRSEARKAVRQANRAVNQATHESHQIKKNMGARKWRRVENARILAAFVDPEDVYYDSRDLIPDTVSAFARLLSDEAGMRAWNAFIDKESEEEQVRFLKNLGHENANLQFNERKQSAVPRKTNVEKRTQHPAYSANECFQDLDKRFRLALSKREKVPMRMLEDWEKKLRSFFLNKPDGKWSESVESNYKRFYLHAVAQFLRLKSTSHEQSKGPRITFVENPRQTFTPPTDSLCGFLSRNPQAIVK
ncbi:R3H domain-containing protein 4 [Aphelenchoides besseyi]|nr:R3H domain-containing protein 4 [Aphelenchoides besseyi]KAI6194184.1 R3H domain-containing protein 4 [Aphelenchoides besseyi]